MRKAPPQTGLAKAIKGATKPKDAPPKAKYIQQIQDHLQTHYDDHSLRDFFALFSSRLAVADNSTADANTGSLKAHMIFHTHILSDNNYILPKYYLWAYLSSSNGCLPQHLETRMAQAASQDRLMAAYNRYLNQRVADYAVLKCDPLREKRDKTSVVDDNTPVVINLAPSSTHLLDQAQCVIGQVRLILDCIFTPELLENSIYNCIYNLLATDLATLFRFLNLTIVHALQNFFSLARPDAERTLFLYKEYTQLQIVDEVLGFAAQAPNMAQLKDFELPHALQQNKQSIQQLTKALESYLFKRDDESERTSRYSSSTSTRRDTTITATTARTSQIHQVRQSRIVPSYYNHKSRTVSSDSTMHTEVRSRSGSLVSSTSEKMEEPVEPTRPFESSYTHHSFSTAAQSLTTSSSASDDQLVSPITPSPSNHEDSIDDTIINEIFSGWDTSFANLDFDSRIVRGLATQDDTVDGEFDYDRPLPPLPLRLAEKHHQPSMQTISSVLSPPQSPSYFSPRHVDPVSPPPIPPSFNSPRLRTSKSVASLHQAHQKTKNLINRMRKPAF